MSTKSLGSFSRGALVAGVLGAALVTASAVPAWAAGVGAKPMDGVSSVTQGTGPAGSKHGAEDRGGTSPIVLAGLRGG